MPAPRKGNRHSRFHFVKLGGIWTGACARPRWSAAAKNGHVPLADTPPHSYL